MSNPTESHAKAFFSLRALLFRDALGTNAPRNVDQANAEARVDVMGAVLECELGGSYYLVHGLRDGTASLYMSAGGSCIGGKGRPPINAAAKKFVETAESFITLFQPVDEYPLPAPGRARFSILTSSGVLARETDENRLKERTDELLPLYLAAHNIIAGFRMARESEERQPQNESVYVNCLLTALARGTGKPAILKGGEELPNPSEFTVDEQDLAWFAENRFQFPKLSSVKVIQQLLQMAGFGSSRTSKSIGHIKTKVTGHDGKTYSDLTFVVSQRFSNDQTLIEVSVDAAHGQR